jgi:hypothetical protein
MKHIDKITLINIFINKIVILYYFIKPFKNEI